jgi:predicted nuclease with RNAse H fold
VSRDNRTWIGVDPGGKKNFGVAVLQPDGSAYTCCVSCADEAVEAVSGLVNDEPGGIGAALVQGAMFVQRVRELFPRLPVTETHPKALLVAMGMTDGEAFRSHFSIQQDGAEGSEHERDAMISAVAAREGFEDRWARDLSVCRYPGEQDPSRYWLKPVHYYWPE